MSKCIHEWELVNPLDIKREDGSILQVGPMDCAKCDDTLPGALQICLPCLARQDLEVTEKIYLGTVKACHGTCDVCHKQDMAVQVIL